MSVASRVVKIECEHQNSAGNIASSAGKTGKRTIKLSIESFVLLDFLTSLRK